MIIEIIFTTLHAFLAISICSIGIFSIVLFYKLSKKEKNER